MDNNHLFPMSRTSDPETSKRAADQHVMRLSERRAQVLHVLTYYPGSTSGELGRAFLSAYPELGIRCAAETPHKRLPELEKMGLVRRHGTKQCSDSGNEAAAWYMTGKGYRALYCKNQGG